MSEHSPLSTFATARTIGLISDAHGNLEFLIDGSQKLTSLGAGVLVQLGDFGLVWDGLDHERRQQARLDDALRVLGRKMFVVSGNHESFNLIEAIEPDADGLRWIGTNIAFLPRSGRITTEAGIRIGWLGGASSIDKYSRDRWSWWEQESITEADLTALGIEGLGVLLGHDSPRTEALRLAMEDGWNRWSASAIEYAAAGQEMFHRGFVATEPKLVIGGHYHLHLDEVESFAREDGTQFESRVVILDMERAPKSAALLDAVTLELETVDVPLQKRMPLEDSGAELSELRRRSGLAPDAAAARLGIGASTFEMFLVGRLTPAPWILDAMRQWSEAGEE